MPTDHTPNLILWPGYPPAAGAVNAAPFAAPAVTTAEHYSGFVVWHAADVECCGQVVWPATLIPSVWDPAGGHNMQITPVTCRTCSSTIGPRAATIVPADGPALDDRLREAAATVAAEGDR